MDKFLTPKDVKEILHIGKNQTYRLMSSKGFPSLRLNGKILVSETSFNTWIQKYTGKTYNF